MLREGPSPELRGYALAAAAQINVQTLRYQWFDHIFKGTSKPALLADRVNYQVSGSRSEEHTSELQSLMRNSYAVFCLKKKNNVSTTNHIHHNSVTAER